MASSSTSSLTLNLTTHIENPAERTQKRPSTHRSPLSALAIAPSAPHSSSSLKNKRLIPTPAPQNTPPCSSSSVDTASELDAVTQVLSGMSIQPMKKACSQSAMTANENARLEPFQGLPEETSLPQSKPTPSPLTGLVLSETREIITRPHAASSVPPKLASGKKQRTGKEAETAAMSSTTPLISTPAALTDDTPTLSSPPPKTPPAKLKALKARKTGLYYYKRQQFETAAFYYTKSIQAYNKGSIVPPAIIHAMTGLCYLQSGDLENSSIHLQAAEQNPLSVPGRIWSQIAHVFLQQGKYQDTQYYSVKSTESYEHDQKKRSFEHWEVMASIQIAKGNFSLAADCAEKGLIAYERANKTPSQALLSLAIDAHLGLPNIKRAQSLSKLRLSLLFKR